MAEVGWLALIIVFWGGVALGAWAGLELGLRLTIRAIADPKSKSREAAEMLIKRFPR